MSNEDKKRITVYCHFSFKRPQMGRDGTGLFAVAFYKDFEGKKLIWHNTTRQKLWVNHQFITAIQSYENVLRVISSLQGGMIKNGITDVALVTDNTILAGWIENPNKNKAYTQYMNRATCNYKVGAPKEIRVTVGLCDARDYEKSYKYCMDKYVQEPISNEKETDKKSDGTRVIDLGSLKSGYKTITSVMNEISAMPIIEGGIKEIYI